MKLRFRATFARSILIVVIPGTNICTKIGMFTSLRLRFVIIARKRGKEVFLRPWMANYSLSEEVQELDLESR